MRIDVHSIAIDTQPSIISISNVWNNLIYKICFANTACYNNTSLFGPNYPLQIKRDFNNTDGIKIEKNQLHHCIRNNIRILRLTRDFSQLCNRVPLILLIQYFFFNRQILCSLSLPTWKGSTSYNDVPLSAYCVEKQTVHHDPLTLTSQRKLLHVLCCFVYHKV